MNQETFNRLRGLMWFDSSSSTLTTVDEWLTHIAQVSKYFDSIPYPEMKEAVGHIMKEIVSDDEPMTTAWSKPSRGTILIDDKQDLFDRIKRESKFPTHALPDPEGDMNLYVARIQWMNRIFELEVNEKPTNLGVVRLLKFYKTIIDEITELLDCINGEGFKDFILSNDPFLTSSDDPMYIENILSQYEAQHGYTLEVNMKALADTLVDINVYDTSEAVRWGIPFDECCHAVMESQITKLDENGKPLKSADGAKFIKGPYYEPPESRIQDILDEHSK